MCFVVDFCIDSSFVPPLIYAFMGSSRDIAIGPVAVVSLLLGTMLQNEIDPISNKAAYRRLAFTATFFAGLTEFALGFFRFINIICIFNNYFLSYPFLYLFKVMDLPLLSDWVS